MKYERIMIDAPELEEFMPGAKLYMGPKLPMLEFELHDIEYKFTDLRWLNEFAIECFDAAINYIANTPDCKEVSFDVTGVDKSRIEIASDILTSTRYEMAKKVKAKKGNKTISTSHRPFLCTGATHSRQDDKEVLTLKFLETDAKAIYEYAQKHRPENGEVVRLKIHELVEAVALANDKKMQEGMKKAGIKL
jgi:hypothetical protein